MSRYKHYKGGIYEYIGQTEALEITEALDSAFKAARHTETGEEITIGIINYKTRTKYIANKEYGPLVIYMDKRCVIWARPADMFHGHLEDGTKRFTEIDPYTEMD